MKLNFKQSAKSGSAFAGGFTLVELLVVIAIIGILSSVAVVNLSSARDKAKEAAVLAHLNNLQPLIILCLSDDIELRCADEELSPADDLCNSSPVRYPTLYGGSYTSVCLGSSVIWPDLSEYGWKYDTSSGLVVNFASDANAGTWTTVADKDDDTRRIICNETGCTASDL